MNRSRIEVPPDPRDLPGDFAHRLEIDVRFADTDAMGHVNNARYLTYCEIARVGYWTDVTGEPFAAGHGRREHDPGRGPDHLPRTGVPRRELAVETRATRIGRTSFTLEHGSPRARRGRRRGSSRRAIDAGPLRLRRRARRRRCPTSSSPRSRRSRGARSRLTALSR